MIRGVVPMLLMYLALALQWGSAAQGLSPLWHPQLPLVVLTWIVTWQSGDAGTLVAAITGLVMDAIGGLPLGVSVVSLTVGMASLRWLAGDHLLQGSFAPGLVAGWLAAIHTFGTLVAATVLWAEPFDAAGPTAIKAIVTSAWSTAAGWWLLAVPVWVGLRLWSSRTTDQPVARLSNMWPRLTP